MHYLPHILLAILQLSSEARAYSIPGDWATTAFSKKNQSELHRREDNDDDIWTYDNGTPVGENYWTRAKTPEDIEAFRARYNLTIVDRTPQDAALLPSWPQALVQFLLINPPYHTGITMTEERPGQKKYHQKLTLFNAHQAFLAPFMFLAWFTAFVMSEVRKTRGGWISAFGWGMWFDLVGFYGGYSAIPILIQWPLSLALILQRRYSSWGSVAYEITDLHGCTPYDGNWYLQHGARSNVFLYVQDTMFGLATVMGLVAAGKWHRLAPWISVPALAVTIMVIVFAAQGTPIVASGNCLLVELNPRLGFLDSEISTRWKVLAMFMGF